MYPLFNSMFTPQFADHSWITDTKTFCPDAKLMWQNAALSLELSGLHNIYYSSNPYANVDFNTNLINIWNRAYQNANATMASSLASFASMQNFFPAFQPVGQIPSQPASDPAPKSTLTEEEKTEFEEKQTKFNELMEKYGDEKIDKAVAEKLGLDSAIKWAKEAFKKADTPERVEKCIEDFEIKLAEIAEEKGVDVLKEVLPIKYESPKDLAKLGRKVRELYNESSDFESVIYNLITQADAVITDKNVIQEMNTRQGKTCLIDEISFRYHDADGWVGIGGWDKAKYKEVINALIDAIKVRSEEDTCIASDEVGDAVGDAVEALDTARNKYFKDMDDENRKNMVLAYINLYNAIRTAEAEECDSKNESFVKTLPDAYKERYMENGELRPEFKYPNRNNGFVLKECPEETVGKVEKKKPETTPMAATVVDQATNPFSAEDVDGVTGAARVADNIPKSFWNVISGFPRLR